MNIIQNCIDKLKNSKTIKKLFNKYNVDLQELDLYPICFSKLDVSARTEHGIIYLNWDLLKKPNTIPMYLAHELCHVLQQTTGDGPTEGSTDDNYLDNEFEQEGFQVQTEFITENEGSEEAEEYIDKVLDHHEMEGNEREEKKDELLAEASLRKKNAGLLKYPEKLYKEMSEWLETIMAFRNKIYLKELIQKNIPKQEKYINYSKSIDDINKYINQIKEYDYTSDLTINYDANYNILNLEIKKVNDNYYLIYKIPNKEKEYNNINKSFVDIILKDLLKLLISWKDIYNNFIEYNSDYLDKYQIIEIFKLLKYLENKVSEDHIDNYGKNSVWSTWEILWRWIRLDVYFNRTELSQKDTWDGILDPPTQNQPFGNIRIVVNAENKDLDSFKKSIHFAKDILRHELQHAVQNILATQKKNYLTGLPGKSISDRENIDYQGQTIKENTKDYPTESNDPYKRIIHSLRDVEFYPRLSDSIEKFLKNWNDDSNFTKKWKKLAGKIFIGLPYNENDEKLYLEYYLLPKVEQIRIDIIDDFFNDLKKYQPDKWKKAVKEFYKKVDLDSSDIYVKASNKQLSLDFAEQPANKSRKDFFKDLDDEIVKSKEKYNPSIWKLQPEEQENRLKYLKNILNILEEKIINV